MQGFVLFLRVIAFSILVSAFTALDILKKHLLQLKKYTSERPQEKIDLHIDKYFYVAGDTIWFKAYIVNAEENALSGLSEIVYVDLIDAKDSIRQTLKLPVESGLSWDILALLIPLSKEDTIFVPIRWMRNFDESYFLTGNLISYHCNQIEIMLMIS